MNRAELEKKAKELKISFTDDTSDVELNKMIEEAEAEINKKKDPDYLEKELKKVISQRDRLKDERRKLEEQVESFNEKVKGLPSKEDIENSLKELKELREFKKAAEEELEKKHLESMDDEDRKKVEFNKIREQQEAEFKKQFEELNSKIEESNNRLSEREKEIDALRQKGLESEVVAAAATMDAFRPEQIYKLLKDEFTYNSNLNTYQIEIRDSNGKIKEYKSVSDRVREYLDDDGNQHLVKSKINNDSLNRDNNDNHIKPQDKDKDKSKYDPNDEKLKAEAKRKGLSVEDLININTKRDEKLAKVEENRNK